MYRIGVTYMIKLLSRIVVLSLVPCLVADPLLASADPSLSWAAAPSLRCFDRFSTSALELSLSNVVSPILSDKRSAKINEIRLVEDSVPNSVNVDKNETGIDDANPYVWKPFTVAEFLEGIRQKYATAPMELVRVLAEQLGIPTPSSDLMARTLGDQSHVLDRSFKVVGVARIKDNGQLVWIYHRPHMRSGPPMWLYVFGNENALLMGPIFEPKHSSGIVEIRCEIDEASINRAMKLHRIPGDLKPGEPYRAFVLTQGESKQFDSQFESFMLQDGLNALIAKISETPISTAQNRTEPMDGIDVLRAIKGGPRGIIKSGDRRISESA
jgi:hypothetical protein